jgi:hypothetical protein
MESHLFKFPDEPEEYWTSDGTSKGVIHRENGPAVIGPNVILWYYEGIMYDFLEWSIRTKKSTEDIIFLKLKYNIT